MWCDGGGDVDGYAVLQLLVLLSCAFEAWQCWRGGGGDDGGHDIARVMLTAERAHACSLDFAAVPSAVLCLPAFRGYCPSRFHEHVPLNVANFQAPAVLYVLMRVLRCLLLLHAAGCGCTGASLVWAPLLLLHWRMPVH